MLLILFLVSSCSEFNDLSPRSKLILKTDTPFFRGLDFDIGINDVKNAEGNKLDERFDDYLRYRIGKDSIGTGEVLELEYFFNKDNQLDLIIAFYSLSNVEDIQPLIFELKDFYEDRYGPPNQDEAGWYSWEFEDETGEVGTIEINLVGETEEGYLGVEVEILKYYEFEERI